MSRIHKGPRGRRRDEQRIRDFFRDRAALAGKDLSEYDVLIHEDGQVGTMVPKTPERLNQRGTSG